MAAWSRILFLACGAFWVLIGVLSALLSDRGIGPPMVFVSTRTDTALFGDSPQAVLAANPQLVTLRYVMIRVLAGLMLGLGALTAGLAWFGLRPPTTWALGLLTIVGLAVIPYWFISLGPYRAAGIRLGLADLPPFMWVPGFLMPLASALGWIDFASG